jgi:hypothetical protein
MPAAGGRRVARMGAAAPLAGATEEEAAGVGGS